MKRYGWIKSWRKKWDNPVIRGHPERIAVWQWIIEHAEWRVDPEERDQHVIEGVRRPLHLGEICCGREQIASDTGVSSSGVQKIVARFASEHMLEQKTYARFRLIQVKNWSDYQVTEQSTEQKRDSRVTATEQVSDTTYKEVQESKKQRRSHGEWESELIEFLATQKIDNPRAYLLRIRKEIGNDEDAMKKALADWKRGNGIASPGQYFARCVLYHKQKK